MNPPPTDTLDLAILLYKSVQNREITGGLLQGVISQDAEFQSFRSRLETEGMLIAAIAHTRTLECQLPEQFFLSLDDLLVAASRRISPIPRFYLADSDCLYDGDETKLPPPAQYYLAAAKLYSLLGTIADHQGGVGGAKTLIFLNKEKIEITPQYDVNDLHELASLKSFESEFITSNTHREQKKTIIKTALFELFAGRIKFPFAELLNRFDDFVEKVRSSYELYVAEFSFQKIKAEVDKDKFDAILKLNKVFSDIQNQLLAVPVALVLVGGQMEDKAAWTSKNVLIWLGALVFSILMELLIRNQRNTLKAVKQEIDQQRHQVESKYQSIAERFSESYREVDARYTHQRRLIAIVEFLVAASFAVTSFLLLLFSGTLCSHD